MTDDTLEHRISFALTRFNVFVFFGTLSILLIVATIYLIAFTPLKEYIPGYADFNTRQVLRELMMRADSLEKDLRQKDLYIHNIRNIIEGREIDEEIPGIPLNPESFEMETLPRSREDSLLRNEMESLGQYGVWVSEEYTPGSSGISQLFFVAPVRGVITNHFDPYSGHFGIDLVADSNEPIKSVLDGTVIFSGWTIETGFTIGIQHSSNLISIYKHNSKLLRETGQGVRAGEVIALMGDTGIYSSGPHLHFELWFNGSPVNPLDYIIL